MSSAWADCRLGPFAVPIVGNERGSLRSCNAKRTVRGLNGLEFTTGVRIVNLAFATLKIRSLCECQAKAEREFGFGVAKELRARIADLQAADTAGDLPAGKPRRMTGKPDLFVLDLARGFRLILRANHSRVPVLQNGHVDWTQVSRVMILRIEDSHA